MTKVKTSKKLIMGGKIIPASSELVLEDAQANTLIGKGVAHLIEVVKEEETPLTENGESVNLDKLTIKELTELATSLGVEVKSSMKKHDLKQAIEDAQAVAQENQEQEQDEDQDQE